MIELESFDHKRIWVNPDHIVHMRLPDTHTYTRLYMSPDCDCVLEVCETPDAICKAIFYHNLNKDS